MQENTLLGYFIQTKKNELNLQGEELLSGMTTTMFHTACKWPLLIPLHRKFYSK